MPAGRYRRAPASQRSRAREETMDAVYVALTIGFFALSLGLVALCDRL